MKRYFLTAGSRHNSFAAMTPEPDQAVKRQRRRLRLPGSGPPLPRVAAPVKSVVNTHVPGSVAFELLRRSIWRGLK
jgi:hypothetical protein